eukprot:5315458-Prymnesium_polylepis.1
MQDLRGVEVWIRHTSAPTDPGFSLPDGTEVGRRRVAGAWRGFVRMGARMGVGRNDGRGDGAADDVADAKAPMALAALLMINRRADCLLYTSPSPRDAHES